MNGFEINTKPCFLAADVCIASYSAQLHVSSLLLTVFLFSVAHFCLEYFLAAAHCLKLVVLANS